MPDPAALAAHLERLTAWRALSHDEQLAALAGPGLGPSPDGRVRVGLLCSCLNMGGAETWQLALARLTDPAKVAWVGCCVVDDTALPDSGMLAATGAAMPVTTGLFAARALAERCDVLVTWAVEGMANLVSGMARPPKVVAVSHSPLESTWSVEHYARASGIDRWAAVSELARDALPGPARRTARVIGNAVDPARLEVRRSRDGMRASWGIPPGARVAGYLGRLSREKDPHAMARLIGGLPGPWHAVVVGAGDESLEAHPRLHPIGPDPAAGDVLNAFDVLVVPSHYESFGLTLAEGLWIGVPVVSTPVGIARLRPGLTYLIPFGADEPTLAGAVLRAHASGPRPGSRDWAREHLAPDRFGREWTDLIVSLAPEPESPGLLAMAGNLTKAVIGHAAGGFRQAPPEVQAERRRICFACDDHHDHERDRCKRCGCTAMDLKRSWASESCPDSPPRWRPV